MGAELLASPVVVVVVLVLVAGASAIHYQDRVRVPVISAGRLLGGYVAVAVSCAVIAAFSSYVPQAEAALKWHVSPEHYWSVQFRTYFVEFTLMACVALLGVALIGVPIVFGLARFGWATVPYVLAASILVSVVAGVLMSAGDSPAFRHLAFTIKYVVGQHILLSMSFCLAVGLPWRRASSQ